MRTIAVFLNLALLATVAYMLFEAGAPKDKYVLFIAIMILAPATSLLALRLGPAQDWISLVLKRKALVERKRIDELNAKQLAELPREW